MMEHFRIQFFSTGQLGGILDIGYTVEQNAIITDLLYVFNAEFDAINKTINIDYKHQYTNELQVNLNKFIIKYKSILPQIQRLGSRFGKLKENEWFFILPPVELTSIQKYEAENELNYLNGCESEFNGEQVRQFFGGVMDNYELVTFDLDRDKKIKIGEKDKSKRICRFCQCKIPDVSFRKEAHAISEALGNKRLILNEECDFCNEFFDAHVERDFIYYHDLARTIFGVKNKDNDTPKMKGSDFDIYKSDEDSLSIAIVHNDKDSDEDGVPRKVVFNTGNKIKIQNIYKALCKFALSVIDSKYLNDFDDTIRWIKSQKEVNSLPKIAVLNSYAFFTRRPELTLYLRNNENLKLPYLVGEFRFTFYLYIFIVPFCSKDTNCFLNDEEYGDFLNCFKHIKEKSGFNFVDFSQNIERKLNFTVNFEKKG